MTKAKFPNIDYNEWFKKYSWENFSSMNGMISTMKNKNYIGQNINSENIVDNIKEHIEKYINTPNDSDLFIAFKLIQTWGGKSVGNHTLKMVENWESKTPGKLSNKEKYEYFVKVILDNKPIQAFYEMLRVDKKAIKNSQKYNIKGLGNSFIPKHICFWTGIGIREMGLPILDDVIAKIIYKEAFSKNVDYNDFINDMNKKCNEINDINKINGELQNINEGDSSSQSISMTPSKIEMALFAFAGYFWKTTYTGTFNFREKTENHVDFNEAKLIAEELNIKISNFKSNKDKSNHSKLGIIRLAVTINGENGNSYEVTKENEFWSCTCNSFHFNKNKNNYCKHIDVVKNKIESYFHF